MKPGTDPAEIKADPPLSADDRVLEFKRVDGVCLLTPAGQSLRIEWPDVKRLITRLLGMFDGDPVPRVVFDLEGIDFFNTTFLSLVLECWREVDIRDGALGLCNVSPDAGELLRLAALDLLWPIFTDRHAAIQSLSGDSEDALATPRGESPSSR